MTDAAPSSAYAHNVGRAASKASAETVTAERFARTAAGGDHGFGDDNDGTMTAEEARGAKDSLILGDADSCSSFHCDRLPNRCWKPRHLKSVAG